MEAWLLPGLFSRCRLGFKLAGRVAIELCLFWTGLTGGFSYFFHFLFLFSFPFSFRGGWL